MKQNTKKRQQFSRILAAVVDVFLILSLFGIGPSSINLPIAHAATAFVKSATNGNFGTSAAATFGSNVAANNIIAAFIAWNPTTATLASLTDTCGTTYTIVDNPTSSAGSRAALAYGKIGTSGSCTVTATGSGTGYIELTVHEISGVDTTTPLDNNQHSIRNQISPGTGANAIVSNSITTTTNGDYIFSATYEDDGNDNLIHTSGTGYTQRQIGPNPPNWGPYSLTEDKIQSTAGPTTSTFTTTAATSNYLTGIMAFKPSGGGGGDTTPPTVSITSPSSGATVSGMTSVTATSTDNVAVIGVQFKFDGSNLGAEDTSFPYSISWDTTTASNASHTLTAVARDAAGNTTTSASVSVTVSNASSDTTAPSIPTNLAATAISSSQINLSWIASTDNVAVTGYRVYRAGSQIATPASNSYSDIGLTASTNYSYTVAAVDAAGNLSAQSSSANGTTQTIVTPPPPPPPSPPGALIDAKRQIDWSQAGAGAIPSRSSICSTLNPGATVAQINSAISACPSGQTVFLNAGTYSGLSGDIKFNNKSNVTLRGAGPDQTFLVFSAAGSCNGLGDVMCLINGDNNFGGDPHNVATWTSGYAQGSTSITLGSVSLGSISNLHVGSLLILDQADDSSDPGNIFVCQTVNVCSSNPGSGNGRPGRAETQQVRVTSISGSGPWTIGITPGIYAPNWRSSQSPGAWWSSSLPVTGDGIENLSVDARSVGATGAVIMMINANFNWVENVRSLNSAVHKHVWLYQASNITVRDSYFYGGTGTSENYGVDGYLASDYLVENNIFQHLATATIGEGAVGAVFGYNYAVDNYYNNGAPGWQQEDAYHHSVGDYYNLWEGHIGSGFTADDIHGTSWMLTMFRSRLTGRDPALTSGTPKTQQTVAVHIYTYSRYMNIIGNILGTVGYHTAYETANTGANDCTPSSSDKSVFVLGFSANNGSCPSFPNDTLVKNTLFRWGNYDTVNSATRFVSSEVPTTAPSWPNAVPSSQTLPASLYLSGQPNWWPASIPWPPIGPDVVGGNIANAAGHAYLTPAATCYLSTMGGLTTGASGALNFNANLCYTTSGTPVSDTTAPSVPTNLSATAISSSQINLSWTASTDNVSVSGYKVFRNGIQVNTTAVNSYSDSGLNASTTYSYTVAAYDAAGNNSSQSSSSSATTQAPPAAKFVINDRVVVATGGAVARSTPALSGTNLQLHPAGDLGTVIGGPTVADGFTWWNINYDTGSDGWTTEQNIDKVTAISGDINTDHIVNAIDYSILNQHWLQTYAPADLNSDGICNSVDYSLLNVNWFKTW